MPAAAAATIIEWASEIEVESGSTLEARGTAHPLEGSVEADWTFSISDLGRMAQYLPPDAVGALHGSLEGTGSLAWSEAGYQLTGRIDGRDVGNDLLTVPRVQSAFAVDPGTVVFEDLKVEIFDGVIEGRMRAPLTDFDAEFEAQLSWSGLDLAALPVTVPEYSNGRVSGRADIGGTVSRPQAEVDVVWESQGSHSVADRLQLRLDLSRRHPPGRHRGDGDPRRTVGGPCGGAARRHRTTVVVVARCTGRPGHRSPQGGRFHVRTGR